jgi:hypothetical protein
MSAPLATLIRDGRWFEVGKTLLLPVFDRPTTFTYGPASLVERVEETLKRSEVDSERS